MFGIILCFVVPGILIGMLFSESVQSARKRARRKAYKHAQAEKKKFRVYDLQEDVARRPVKKREFRVYNLQDDPRHHAA